MSDPDAEISLPPLPSSERRRWIAEILATLMVCIVPAVIASTASYFETSHGSTIGAGWIYASGLAQSSSFLCFALFVMWRSGESWSNFGFVRPRIGLDALMVVAALVCSYLLYYGYAIAVYNFAPDLYPAPNDLYQFAKPRSSAHRIWAFFFAVANGCSEEVVLWGLIYTRLCRISSAAAAPVFVVAAIFASYHFYQGAFAVGGVLIVGIVHGALFLWRPRLLPLMVAHAIMDLQILA